MDLHRPDLSIITAVHNGERTIERTIRSLLPQLGARAEYIVVDGASTDGTMRLVRQYEGAIARIVSEPDAGIYDAWNKGITHSRGRYLAFIGADDVATDDYVRHYLGHIHRRPDIEYWSSQVLLESRPPRVIGQAWDWRDFRRYMCVAHVGSLHKRELYERHGLYDPSYRIAGDYEFLLRAGRHLKAGYFTAITARMGAGGVSNRHQALALREARRAKIESHARGPAMARVDQAVARAKAAVRSLL